MVIDTTEILAAVWDKIPDPDLGDIGLTLLILGALGAGYELYREWVKRKGFRMVLKDRNDKIHAMWLEIIQNGIDDRLVKNLISNKEADAMFAEAASKMKLLDLIPKNRIQKMTKERLKRERALRGVSPNVPVKAKFSEKLGKAASKFWQKKSA